MEGHRLALICQSSNKTSQFTNEPEQPQWHGKKMCCQTHGFKAVVTTNWWKCSVNSTVTHTPNQEFTLRVPSVFDQFRHWKTHNPESLMHDHQWSYTCVDCNKLCNYFIKKSSQIILVHDSVRIKSLQWLVRACSLFHMDFCVQFVASIWQCGNSWQFVVIHSNLAVI